MLGTLSDPYAIVDNTVRLLHTSDWHLGHTLRDISREGEHAAFLAWLLELCTREAPDAMVITGDVFDSSTPSASAERMWFEFLASAHRARPAMDIIAIAGNHDSPARLGAASAVLDELGVHVVSGLDMDRVLVPVAGGRGLVAAVPFLRPLDLPICDDPLGAVYAEVIARARAARAPGQALIVTGHLFVVGAEPSVLSERRVSIGGTEAAPMRLFPDDIDYVALGHLHRAQRVGRDTIRYAGAPMPLALDEARYLHSVTIADFGEGVTIRTVEVPRAIEIVKIAGTLEQVIVAITELPDRDGTTPPYLEVIVTLARPEPRLRQVVETALDGKRARLVQLRVELTGDGAALADRMGARRLAELDPREVFVQLWARDHAEPPSDAVLAAFDRLVAEVNL
jgi:exonuclease SbcD